MRMSERIDLIKKKKDVGERRKAEVLAHRI